jgi:hypothetical protein
MSHRAAQVLFSVSLLLCAWYGMMAMHELGHVAGALVTGGKVELVVLHPLVISRTDVDPNPHPAIVVWLGPIIGCLLPCLLLVLPTRSIVLRGSLQFFAGFCLIANGAYIGVGAWEEIGDCREMLRTGTPLWVMVAFGLVAVGGGLLVWHRLGSLRVFWRHPSLISWRWAFGTSLSLVSYVVVASLLS